jgi:DNA-binding SARP family transcriptional activator
MNSKVTYRQQFTRCGKQRCRKCKEGAGHGPYWYAYWSVNGRTVSKYIGLCLPEDVEIETNKGKPRQLHAPVKEATGPSGNGSAQDQGQKNTLVEIPHTVSDWRTSSFRDTSDKQPALRIYVLGQFRVERSIGNEWQAVASRTWQRHRARALLGCLLSSTGRRLGREQAIEALWPNLDLETAANRLNGAVHEVRQILEPALARPAASQLLRLERDVLLLADASQIWVDADIFEGLLNKANASPDPVQIEKILEEAARLYGGDYLLEELYSEWASTRRESLRRGWMDLLLQLAELRASRGALASAIEPLDRLLATDPTHETAVRRLMLLLTQLDRRAEALRVYQRLATTLQRDYESDPLPETSELYEALRQGHMQVSRSEPSAAAKSLVTTSPLEVQSTLHSPRKPEITQHIIQALPRPALQLGRHNRSPLVGRDRELAIMREVLLAIEDTTRKQKTPHFLLLMGESGIGRTRLAEELSQEANARGWSVAWTHAYEQDGTIPYRPWTGILRTLLQGAPPEFLVSTAEAQFIAPADEAPGTIPYIPAKNSKLAKPCALLPELATYDTLTLSQNTSPSPLPPEQERLDLWEATLVLLSTLSRITPLLLVLDDLQWTDDSSLELLAYLVRHLQDERMLLVGTCRDVELTANSTLRTLINDLRREQSIIPLAIQPLTQPEIGSMVAHLPRDIVQGIQAQAGGNPFFAEELARVSETSLHAPTSPDSESALAKELITPGEEVPLGINLAIPLPETIADVLARRLSKLSSDCQSLLEKAAVLGGSFEFSQLLFMAGDQGTNEDAILDLLEEALGAGLLTEEATGTRITYHFWHPLIVSHLYELSAPPATG